jgi:hypothetical protein
VVVPSLPALLPNAALLGTLVKQGIEATSDG